MDELLEGVIRGHEQLRDSAIGNHPVQTVRAQEIEIVVFQLVLLD